MEGFPNELVDCILDNLYFDTATLLNCALVGRSWVRSAQRGIFRELILEMPDRYNGAYEATTWRFLDKINSLAVVLTEKPSLASYIRYLELRRASIGNWVVLLALFDLWTTLVEGLSNVKQILFCRVSWDGLPAPFKKAMADLFRTPSLTHVSLTEFTIHGYAELTSFLSHATRLKVLAACKVTLENRSKYPTPEGTTPRSIRLDELEFTNDSHLLMDWFQQDSCPFEIRDLQVLRLDRFPHANYRRLPVSSLRAFFPEFAEMLRPVQYVGKTLSELWLLHLDVEGLLTLTAFLYRLYLNSTYLS